MPMPSTDQTEILWDTWGVPHIYAQDAEKLFHAFGWAQAHSHGDLILRLYGQARGRGAEYWGEKYLSSDQYVRTMGIPARAQQWWETQDSEMRRFLEAFAAGINQYAREHPDRIDAQAQLVLPIVGVDLLAHLQRVIHFHFVVDPQRVAARTHSLPPLDPPLAKGGKDGLDPPLGKGGEGGWERGPSDTNGSNAWAISPKRSASGNAMLLANPHLPWMDMYLWYEAQLSAPGIDAYGATLVGMPVLGIAFNDNLGWTFCVNPSDGADYFQLTLSNGGYVYDGAVRAFQTETQILKVKQADGTLKEETLVLKNSVHGPIVADRDGSAVALRVVGLERSQLFQQWWQMAKATNLTQFEAALQHLQLPLFNVLYADKEGQTLYLFNAQIPVKATGDWNRWQQLIPGDTSATLWTEYHTYHELPRLVNPDTGWLQNTNDPPWTCTFPEVLQACDYPAYFTPESLGKAENVFRTQRSLKMLAEAGPMTLDEMIAKKFSSHLEMADRILPALIGAAKQSANAVTLEAAEVLEHWDRHANADSRGAVLFTLWAMSLKTAGGFSTPWDQEFPLTTPNGLADCAKALIVLEQVATKVKTLYGKLDVPWGEVVRMCFGSHDLPASGAPGTLGSFRVLNVLAVDERRFQIVHGDSYIAAIEFGAIAKAKVLTVYGNATQPGSPHVGDQLDLYACGELRPAWRNRQEIEAHLEAREVF
jgi:acyl-homoserine-lactone acylase